MVARSARLLAPIALCAVALGVYLIVHSTMGGHPAVQTPTSAIVNTGRKPIKTRHVPKYYVVRPGDTLSAISIRTGVPLARLTRLNPSLSATPNNLQTGQRLRLRR